MAANTIQEFLPDISDIFVYLFSISGIRRRIPFCRAFVPRRLYIRGVLIIFSFFISHKTTKIMKKVLFVLMIAMTISLTGFNSSAAPTEKTSSNLVENIWRSLPETLVVKQVATLTDGHTITVFYKKAGNLCEIYTNDDLSGISVNDLSDVKESDFAITTSVKGRKIYSAPVSTVRKIIKKAVIQYL